MNRYMLLLCFTGNVCSVTYYYSDKSYADEFKEVKEKIDDYNQFVLSQIMKKRSIYTKIIKTWVLEKKSFYDGFINSVEKDENATEIKLPHICKFTILLNEYQSWLAKEKEIIYRDCGHTQNAMIRCYNKLKELREKYEI